MRHTVTASAWSKRNTRRTTSAAKLPSVSRSSRRWPQAAQYSPVSAAPQLLQSRCIGLAAALQRFSAADQAAAVHYEGLAGHEGAGARGQQHRHTGDVLGLTQAPQRIGA